MKKIYSLNLDKFVSNKSGLDLNEIYNDLLDELLDVITSCDYNRSILCYDIYSYEYIHIICDSLQSHHLFFISNDIRSEAESFGSNIEIKKAFKNQFKYSLLKYIESIEWFAIKVN